MMYAEITKIIGQDRPMGPVLAVFMGGKASTFLEQKDHLIAMVTQAKLLKKIKSEGHGGRCAESLEGFLLADPLNPPIREASLSAVILGYGLGERKKIDPRKLSALRRLLKPGGRFGAAVPLFDGPLGLIGAAAGFLHPYRPKPMSAFEVSKAFLLSGCRYISQVRVSRLPFPWIITLGQTRPRPWEKTA